MSKIQDAIRASKEEARTNRGARRPAPTPKTANRVPDAPVGLDYLQSLHLDADQMERSCLLPYVKGKGAESAYKLLRTRVLKRMRDNQWKSLIVTGTSPNEGKTTTAINLAVAVSQDTGQLVALVDLDLERPSVAEYFGLKHTSGLSDYLHGDAEAKDVLYNTNLDRLVVLPNFEPIQSSESLASPKMLSLLEYILQLDKNIIVIFDMPPVLNSDSVLAFGPYVDALLLVIAEGRTHRSLLQRAGQMIEDIPMAGIVLNQSLEGNAGGYY